MSVHNLVMEQCKQINLTGVSEVKTFDEETVVLDTSKGTLTIRGENLIINSFSATSGDLFMQGEIWALVYAGNQKGAGFLKRILK
ncbi:MAG: sporulation protein YabP [Clostridia bacterium]|nr:sporulation protein YabP [Clostridia bacterium]